MLMKIEYPNNDYKEIDILKSSILRLVILNLVLT